MCHAFLSDSNFYDLLYQIDQENAAEVCAKGCPHCGGILHSARYPRNPAGIRSALSEAYESRLSFCCATEGCRRRTTPPSVRFLGRRLYLGAIVVLTAVLYHGLTPKRRRQLSEQLGLRVSLRTLKRWVKWWQGQFVVSPFWKAAKGSLVSAVEVSALPASLLECFSGPDIQDKLVKLLRFISPMTI